MITAEDPGWRIRDADLLKSFSANGGLFLKLTECLDQAAYSDHFSNLLEHTYTRSLRTPPSPSLAALQADIKHR
ncbi:unnamed protein product [Protopolystoma xenopodis]|uniref:Uncharacterized protein n=1 Tax=Protopolystoma xenopodis TaxID=117903 RepID=A0A3S5B415_9PLAT|nr:unnamed protein product [Protopolystoma xenopodis]